MVNGESQTHLIIPRILLLPNNNEAKHLAPNAIPNFSTAAIGCYENHTPLRPSND
jgi:hypothetical protein